MRKSLGVIVAAACVTAALSVEAADAAVRFVDGACSTSGTGATLSCGATGPFRTIGEGIVALQPGDTLNVRGAHGTFDGVYFESLGILDGGGVAGKSLAWPAVQAWDFPAPPASRA
jgi:hypothetical protein